MERHLDATVKEQNTLIFPTPLVFSVLAEAAVDDWLRTATPSVPIQGPTGTYVIPDTKSLQHTLTAAVDPAVALAEFMSPGERAIDADALVEVVSRTWDARGNAPSEWAKSPDELASEPGGHDPGEGAAR